MPATGECEEVIVTNYSETRENEAAPHKPYEPERWVYGGLDMKDEMI